MLQSGCLLCPEISILFTIYNNIYNIYSKKIKVNNTFSFLVVLGPQKK
jgi:hypothetical protein